MITATLESTAEGTLAREVLYRFLSAALRDPRDPRFAPVRDPANQELVEGALEILREEADGLLPQLGFGELSPEQLSWTGIAAALSATDKELAADFDRIFGFTLCKECPPYETEFCANAEPFYRSQQLADIGGFYRAFGLDFVERPDYLPLELEYLALLLTKERLAVNLPDESEHVEVCRAARERFLRDHLCVWAPSFTIGLRRKAGGGFYAAFGELLAAFLPLERHTFKIPAPSFPQLPVLSETSDDDSCGGCDATDTCSTPAMPDGPMSQQ